MNKLSAVIAGYRLNHFVAGLTNTNPATTAPVYKQYVHVQYGSALAVSATASVTFPPSAEKFRYVVIQKQFTSVDAICMKDVKVFTRGSLHTLRSGVFRISEGGGQPIEQNV